MAGRSAPALRARERLKPTAGQERSASVWRRDLIGLGEALPFASRGERGRCPNEALGVLAKPAPGKGLILQIFEAALFARGNRVAGRDGALEPVAGLLEIPGHPPAGGIEPG